MSSGIRYIKRNDIEIEKWDRCIHNAAISLIYPKSFYLDAMSKNWDALVLNDYETVMPLTWNRKYGISYLYQPAFTPMLGVFGTRVHEKSIGQFINAIPEKFKLIEINLNPDNIYSFPTGFSILRKSYVLKLDKPYEQIQAGYRENIKRNIKKCVQANCTVKKNIPVEDVIGLSKDHLSALTNVKDADFKNFRDLFNSMDNSQRLTYGIYRGEKLLSAAAYFISNGRAYYILAGNHPDGKTLGSSHYLVDRFIADHAGSGLVLDFEGSDVASVAFFYESFGATAEIYPAIHINKLPWFVRLLKR